MKTSGVHIASLRRTRRYLDRLFGIHINEYHRCISNCMAFTRDDILLRQCKECKEPRFLSDDKRNSAPFPDFDAYSHLQPRATYQYMKIAPQLQLLYANPESAKKMKEYLFDLANDTSWDGKCRRDIWDGDMMKHWKEQGIFTFYEFILINIRIFHRSKNYCASLFNGRRTDFP
jgi:hypothetical protein